MGYFKESLEAHADDLDGYRYWLASTVNTLHQATKAKVCMDCGNKAFTKGEYCIHQAEFYRY
tara:strand:+ start:43 stop:228 length:186 start_codon:yes stop_codon:yes gene_type:complete